MLSKTQTSELLIELLKIYDQKQIAEYLNPLVEADWCRETINRVLKGKSDRTFNEHEEVLLTKLIPAKPPHYDKPEFTFIDLFAGIGGIRKGFDQIGGKCIFTSEWNKFAQRTYRANNYCGEDHLFNSDITDITLSNTNASELEANVSIKRHIPTHDVLLAGFPCQPFSLAGVSKKNSLGRAHGFACDTQGTLFFDVCRILEAKRPKFFLLENVKNLRSHDKGKTFKVIKQALDELGYDVADVDFEGSGAADPKIIDGKHFVPQHRERIVLVGSRRDLGLKGEISLRDIQLPQTRPTFREILEPANEVDPKYTLTPNLWQYLYEYAKKHQAKGNGFGFGLVDPNDPLVTARTLSARYHKDGSEILIDRGWDMTLGEQNFNHEENLTRRPRRLTPLECARLMGFIAPGECNFVIPVSDTQAYRQFGNSVVVPVFNAVAKLMKPYILNNTTNPLKPKIERLEVASA